MEPFISTYRMYALQVSAATGIPPTMMGVGDASNPTSAEALRVAKDRLIQRAEVKQRQFSDSLERVARLALEMVGHDSEELRTLEVQWRDAAAPSASAMTALALQAHSQGVLSTATTLDFLRLTPQQRAREDALGTDLSVMSGMTMPDQASPDPGDEVGLPQDQSRERAQEARENA